MITDDLIIKSPAEGEGNEGFPPPPDKVLESLYSTRLEALVPSRVLKVHLRVFPDSSVGKQSACNAGDPGLIPGSGRSHGEGLGHHSSILGLPL